MILAILFKMFAYGFLGFLGYLIAGILFTMARNYRAHQFFKKLSPNLPCLPNPSLLSGHLIEYGFEKRLWKSFDEVHKKYGKTVGAYFSERAYITTVDLDLIRDIFIKDPYENINRTKSGITIKELENNIAFNEDDQWRRLRKVFAPVFSPHKLKTPVVMNELNSIVNKFIESLDSRIQMNKLAGDSGKEGTSGSAELNVDEISHRFSLDILLTSLYKKPNSIDYNSETDYWVELMDNISSTMASFPNILATTFPFIGRLFHWYVDKFHIQAKLRDNIFALIREATKTNLEARKEARLNENKSDNPKVDSADRRIYKQNLIDYIIDQYHAGKLNETEYMNSSYIMFLAGNKTTGDTISKILYYLAMNQEVQVKLRESIFKDGVDSQYLLWVIQETLRLIPPVPFGVGRNLTKDKTTSDGYFIPKGVAVMTPAWTIHRLKEYWGEDANEFRPERWSKASSFHPCQYMAFGFGPRNCLGKEMAMLDMKVLINAVIRKFKFERTDRTPEDIDFFTPFALTVIFATPCYVKVSHFEPDKSKCEDTISN